MQYKCIRFKIMKELEERFNDNLKEYKLWSETVAKVYLSKEIADYDKYLALLYAKKKLAYYQEQMEQLEKLSVGGVDGSTDKNISIH